MSVTGHARRAWSTRFGAAITGAVLATCALLGCGGTTDESAAVAPAMEQGAAGMPADMGMPGADMSTETVSTKVDRQIVRTAYLAIRVTDVNTAAESVLKVTAAQDGVVLSEDISGQGDAVYASITTQVPAASLPAYLDALKALGTVDSVNVTSQDVTTQAVDLDARVAALTASIARLDELLAQATNVTDLVTIEAERTARQADLDSLVAQRKALADQVAMSTVSISLSSLAGSAEWSPPGFIPGLQTGWSAFLSLLGLLITLAGFLVPFAIVLAVVLTPLIWWLVRRRRHRRSQR